MTGGSVGVGARVVNRGNEKAIGWKSLSNSTVSETLEIKRFCLVSDHFADQKKLLDKGVAKNIFMSHVIS